MTQNITVYHYTNSSKAARSITQSGMLHPSCRDVTSFYDRDFTRSRVNFTTIPPEEGLDKVMVETGIGNTRDLEYCLEVEVPRGILSQSDFTSPSTYHVFSDNSVPVKVKKIWNVARLERSPKHIVRSGKISYLDN